MVNKKLSRSDIKSVKELLEGGRSPLTIQDYVKKELGKNISLARISEIKKQNNIKVKSKAVPSVSEFIKEKGTNNISKRKINYVELTCRVSLSFSIIIIAGLYLNSFKIVGTIDILFNLLLVGVVMHWGLNMMDKSLW